MYFENPEGLWSRSPRLLKAGPALRARRGATASVTDGGGTIGSRVVDDALRANRGLESDQALISVIAGPARRARMRQWDRSDLAAAEAAEQAMQGPGAVKCRQA